MTMQMTEARRPSYPYLRSAGAVLAGFLSIAVLSTVTDQILHATGVFPPDGQPNYDTATMGLALAYRSAFGVLAGYITARLAPSHKLAHALVLGLIGVALSTAGAVVMWNMGPPWYAIGVVLIAIPAAWLGARLHLSMSR